MGWHRLPTGLEDVSKYPALVAELLARNWTEEEVKGALAQNLLRVFRQVERVSGTQGRTGQGDTWTMGTQGAQGHLGQETRVEHQGMWHSGIYGTRGGTGTHGAPCVGMAWWHRKAQGGRGSVWMGTAILSQPTLSPRQVKTDLQNTAPYESPIALEELEGSCRTNYGYSTDAGTAQRPSAALALALVLAPLLSVFF